MTLTTLCLSRHLHRNEAQSLRLAAERLACDEADKLTREFLTGLAKETNDARVIEVVRRVEVGLRAEGLI